MTAVGRQIADAIVTDGNDGGWSLPVTFVAKYVVNQSLEETEQVETLTAWVVYSGQRASRNSRDSWAHEYDIDIGLQKKLKTDTLDEADELSELLDEIVDHWKQTAPISGARLTGFELMPFSPERMTQSKAFTGTARLTFRKSRDNS